MPVLGVSSIYMYPKNVINAIKEAAIMGFRHINIFAYPPHFKEDSDEFVNNVKRVIFEYGMDCSIKIQGYTINPVATNPNLRKKSIEEINIDELMELAYIDPDVADLVKLGTKNFVIGCME